MKSVVEGAAWGVGSAVVIWALPTGRATPMDAAVGLALEQVGDFGAVEHAEVTTAESGEEAWVGPVPPTEPLVAFVRAAPDAEEVHLELAVAIPGLAEPLHGAATLKLSRDDGPLEVTLFLHTNAYAARTFTAPRDNRAVAQVLAPRLRALLARLRAAFGGDWVIVDAGGYLDQLDPDGFRL